MKEASMNPITEQQAQPTSNQLQRVADMVEDNDSDDEREAANRSKAKPGAITPLGVRVDKGQGLLSVSGASATLAEMDAAIGSIRGWQQRQERDMADMLRRHEAALQAAMATAVPDYTDALDTGQYTSAGAAFTSSSSAASADGADDRPLHASSTHNVDMPLRVRPISACPTSTSSTLLRTGSAAERQGQQPVAGVVKRSLGPAELELLKASADLRFAQLSADIPRPSTGSRLRPATAGHHAQSEPSVPQPPGMTADSLPSSPARAGLLPPLPAGGLQQALLPLRSVRGAASRLCEGQVTEELPWQRRSLSRASSSSSTGAAAARQADVLTLPHRSSKDGLGSAAPALVGDAAQVVVSVRQQDGRLPMTNTLQGVTEGGARPTVAPPRGQQLLDELEAELRALDGDLGSELSDWYSDYESVVARMDRLQSGYQVQLRLKLGARTHNETLMTSQPAAHAQP